MGEELRGSLCDRCGKPTRITTMSFFNTDILCMDCSRREKAHPKYPEAHAAEVAAVMAGDMNFPGIGCPPELLEPEK